MNPTDYLGLAAPRVADTIWFVPLSATPFEVAASGSATIEWQDADTSAAGRDSIHCAWSASGASSSSRRFAQTLVDGFKVVRGSMIHLRFQLKGQAIASGWKPSILIKGTSQYQSGGAPVYINTVESLSATHTGTFDWIEVNQSVVVNDDFVPEYIALSISTDGMKSGECWVTSIRATIEEPKDVMRPAPGLPFTQPFAGLRGFQLQQNPLRSDLYDLGGDYKANLARFQVDTITGESPAYTDKTDMGQWDVWFAAKKVRVQETILWARQNDIKLIIAMLLCPGGHGAQASQLMPYNSVYMMKYLDAWRQLATLCLGAPEVIAFDVLNEPAYVYPTYQQGPGHSFRSTQIAAIDAIREIDPTRWCVFESEDYASPTRFKYMVPIDRERIIYSFHMYKPSTYVFQAGTSLTYPGMSMTAKHPARKGIREFINITLDKAFLREQMDAVRDFQLAYQVPIFMGEFSGNRWAPGLATYLRDVADIADEYGWAWTYHNFRGSVGSNMFDVEFEALPTNQAGGVPAVGITDRGAALRAKFALNQSPYTAAEQAPVAPTGITVTDPWATDALVSWTPARCLVGSWLVEYRVLGSGSWNQVPAARDKTSVLVTGLSVDTTYEYRVTLVNVHGQAVSASTSMTKGSSYVLDGVTATPSYAYSTDRLLTAYTGPVLRVRRSSDNAERDISTVGGVLDEADLLDFVGAGSGFVRTVYDQTDNLRHLHQPTLLRQPRIVNAGVVDKVGVAAAITLLAASSHWMVGAFAPLYAAGAATIVGVWRNNASAADSYLFGETSSTLFNPFYDVTSGSPQSGEAKMAIRDDAGATFSGNGGSLQVQGFTNGTVRAFRVVDTGSTIRVASNTTAEAQDTTYNRATHTLTLDQTALGARLRQAGADKFASMSVVQIIAFPAQLSNADEAAIQAHQVRWYGL